MGGELAEHLQRAAILLEAVAAGDVEIQPVALRFLQKVVPIPEALPVEEFVLAEAVDGFDIALVGVGGRGDEGVGNSGGFPGGFEAMGEAAMIPAS